MRLAITAPLLLYLLAVPLVVGGEELTQPSLWDVEEILVDGDAKPLFASGIHAIEKRPFEGPVEPVFASLDESTWIEIDYETKGCFDAQEREIEVRGGANPEATISTPGLFPDDPKSGVLSLAREDLERLDRLLGFYRTIDEGTCTTRERVVLRWKQGRFFPRTIRTDEYLDETCGTTFLDNILTFRELLIRFSEPDAV